MIPSSSTSQTTTTASRRVGERSRGAIVVALVLAIVAGLFVATPDRAPAAPGVVRNDCVVPENSNQSSADAKRNCGALQTWFPFCVIPHQPLVGTFRFGDLQFVQGRFLDDAGNVEVDSYISVKNQGPAVPDLTATVTLLSPTASVIDGTVGFGRVRKNELKRSLDTFTIRANINQPLGCPSMVWTVGDNGGNAAPVIDAGPDRTTHPGAPVPISATATDPDGDTLTISWSVVSKPAGSNPTLAGASTLDPVFTTDKLGTYVLKLTVDDGEGAVVTDTMTVSVVNAAPTANAGPDQSVEPNATANLEGTGSDPDGDPISMGWAIISQPIGSTATLADPGTATPSFTPSVPGNYVVRLTVTDIFGSTATDEVVVTVLTGNLPPSVNAGPDQSTTRNTLVTLAATASDPDGDPVSVTWMFVLKPIGSNSILTTPNQLTTAFTPDTLGTYVLAITATDGKGGTATDTMHVIVVNADPTASAGPDQLVNIATTTLLSGNASDPDGDVLTYSWSITTGPAGSVAVLTGASTASPTLVPDVAGSYTLTLTVTDGHGGSATDQVVVVANTVPVVDAGPAKSTPRGANITLDGSASDADGDSLTLNWTVTTEPAGAVVTLTGASTATPSFEADTLGEYLLTFTANDGKGGAASDTVLVTVVNLSPTADAGADQTVATSSTVNLSGNGSDPDGDPLNYSWAFLDKPGGSIAALTNSTTKTPSFTADGDGAYAVRLTVTDGKGGTATDDVLITASTPNQPPLADAGESKVTLRDTAVTLNGSASDPDGDTLTVTWTVQNSPAGSNPVLTGASTLSPSFTANVIGSYVLLLTVSDGNAAPVTDSVSVSVINGEPTAIAGPDQDALTGSTVPLDGSASSDPDGDALSFAWAFVTRPGGSVATIGSSTTATPTFTPDKPGTYTIKLTVEDGQGGSATDTVVVVVVNPNQAPLVDAGADDSTPRNVPVALAATASDPDGDPLTISWTVESKPLGSTASVANGTTLSPALTANTLGSYTLKVTAIDGKGGTASDIVVITVVNRLPVADAGADKSVPKGSAVALNGAASSDPDNDPLTYHWTLFAKPAASTAVLSGATTVNPTFTADVKGTYEVRLVVNDGFAPSPFDAVLVLVDNTLPVADLNVDQPAKPNGATFNLTATASDPDGDPVTLAWSLTTKPAGSSATLTVNPSGLTATLVADRKGTYTAQVIPSDTTGSGPAAGVTFTATNRKPIADAEIASSPPFVGGVEITLDGAGSSDPDGDPLVSYGWTIVKPGGTTVALPSGVTTTFVPTAPGNYSAKLIVSDGTDSSDPDTVTFTVDNQKPNANAGPDQAKPNGNSFTLDGSASSDPDGDPLTYAWSVTTRPAGSSANPVPTGTVGPTITPDRKGSYTLQLVVNDGTDNSDPDTVTIVAQNRAPVANAGTTLFKAPNTPVTLNGTASNDPDNDPLTYGWTVLQKPAASSVTGPLANSATPSWTPDLVGTYVFQLVVSDDDSASSPPVTVTIYVNSILIAPVAEIGPGQSTSVPVSLAAPAPPGGISITLTSGNPTVGTLPASVFIPAGAFAPAVNPQITGNLIGTTTVSATYSDFGPGLANVVVTVVLQFNPTTQQVPVGSTRNYSLTINHPAPPGGLTLNIALANPALALVPASVTIPAGQNSVLVTVAGSAPGTTTMTASKTGTPEIVPKSATIVVVPGIAINLGPDATIGKDLQVRRDATVGAVTAGVAVTITVTSSDPTKLLLSSSPSALGSATVDLVVPAGTVSLPPLYLQALTDTGTVTLTATGPEHAPDTLVVTLVPSGFVWSNPVTDQTTALGNNRTFVLLASALSPAPALSFLANQPVRAGLATVNVPVTNSAPAVGSIAPASVAFAANDAQKNVTFDPQAVGVTTLTAVAPAGFSTPPIGSPSPQKTVTVIGDTMTVPAATVGRNLAQLVQVNLSAPVPVGGTSFTFTSTDPSKLLIAPNLATPGSDTLVVNVPVNQVSFTIAYQSLANTGSVAVAVASTLYTANTPIITLAESAIVWHNPANESQNAFAANQPRDIVTRRAPYDSATLNQPIRAGFGAVNVSLTNSDPAVGSITPSTVTFNSNEGNKPTVFDPLDVGTTTLGITNDGGFPVVAQSSKTWTVTGVPLALAATPVGKDLQTTSTVTIIAGLAPAGGQAITLSSADSSRLLVAPNASTVGTASIIVTIPAGQSSVQFTLQSLDSTGAVNLTASAPGLIPANASVALTPSGFGWIPINDVLLKTSSPNATVTLSPFRVTGPVVNGTDRQAMRWGLPTPVTVDITNDAPVVGTHSPSSVAFSQGDSQKSLQFDPANEGTAHLTIVPPVGHVAAGNLAVKTIVVSGDPINFSAPPDVGLDLQIQTNFALSVAPPAPVAVTAFVTDPAIATLTTDPLIAGSGTVNFANVANTTARTFYIQGRQIGSTTIQIQAAGYTDSIHTITVGPSGFRWSDGSPTAATTPFSNLNLAVAGTVLHPVTLATVAFQAVRGGISVNVPLTTDAPLIGQLPASVTLTPNQTQASVLYDALTPGVANLTVGVPAGWSTPGNARVKQVTVNLDQITVSPSAAEVGEDLQRPLSFALGSVPPGGSRTVSISISDPSVALLSTSASSGGSDSVVVPNVTTSSLLVYVQGVTSGSATITFSAPDYAPKIVPVTVGPSGFTWGANSLNAGATAGNIGTSVVAWRLDGAGGLVETFQGIRPGLTVPITVTSSNPAVGGLSLSSANGTGAGSLTFNMANPNSTFNLFFDPVSAGTTTLTVEVPAGFDTPAIRRIITATVT